MCLAVSHVKPSLCLPLSSLFLPCTHYIPTICRSLFSHSFLFFHNTKPSLFSQSLSLLIFFSAIPKPTLFSQYPELESDSVCFLADKVSFFSSFPTNRFFPRENRRRRKMNAFASECGSGCESGWTLYLEQSFLNQNGSHRDNRFYGECKEKRVQDEEEAMEEDLSMVSDASSGPPHFPDDEAYFNEVNNGCFYPPMSSKSAKPKKTGKERKKVGENQHLISVLDDTASSPVYDFPKNNVTITNQQGSTQSMLDYSQGFSATYFEERSSFPDHFGYLQSSISQNELQNNQWYGGKMR